MKKEMTPDELYTLVKKYSVENNIEVFTDIDITEKGLKLDIDQGFIDFFEENYTCDLTLEVEKLFQNLIERYSEEIIEKEQKEINGE